MIKIQFATLPSGARALKDAVVILRKCPWGAMTGEDYDTVSPGRGLALLNEKTENSIYNSELSNHILVRQLTQDV